MPRRPNYDRDELIDRAKDLFWKQGWAGTSLKDLEQELQMKPGSFYAAFGSKDALFELSLDRYFSDGQRRLTALVEQLGPLSALRAFPRGVVTNAAAPAKACMLGKSVLELSGRGHPMAAVANGHLNAMEDSFRAVFADAQARGEIGQSHEPATLARRYQSDLMGLRLSAERDGVDAIAIADEIAAGLDRL